MFLAGLLATALAYTPLSEYAPCSPGGLHCVTGTRCVGANGIHFCLRGRASGASCSLPYTFCGARTACVGGICKSLAGLGGSCRKSEDAVCRSGLACLNGICSGVVGPGEACTGLSIRCQEGLGCLRHASGSVCEKVVGAGEKCGGDGIVCGDGLSCTGGPLFELICTPTVPRRDESLPPGVLCTPGTSQCTPPEECIRKRVSQTGYVSTCTKVVHTLGESCVGGAVCKPPMVCAQGGAGLICTKTVAAGEACNGETLRCEAGSVCVGPKGQSRCESKATIPIIDACDGVTCAAGEKCVKRRSSQTGYVPRCEKGESSLGLSCGEDETCADGGTCRRVSQTGYICD